MSKQRACRLCGGVIPDGANRSVRYCGDGCRRRAKAAIRRADSRSKRAEKVCSECAAPLPLRRTKYCSDACLGAATVRKEAERTARRFNAACTSCGKPKDRRGRGIKMCSACAARAEQREADMQVESARRWRQRLQSGAPSAADLEMPEYRDGDKWCRRCREYRDISDFPHRKNASKPSSYCRPCQRAYNTERRLRLNFGMSWDDYELLLVCQDYRCAICRGRPRKHMLAVDHDHKTGEIRGLLCSRCNHKLLGSANDDPARLRAAADYLEQYAPREVFGERRMVPGHGDGA